ncbi:MFS transporter [Methylococcus sp. EFPC2]|uniref:MFS transporter n=1 Tax=Methylococcus sp. EFPC2 TaxID=2812648 RepID=UPI001968A05F|nr:MFS transporter [Methylococcus sp. EFPC2]QSA95498.1 MFS transporter [Methylococcus sp. EFPC2]
MTIAYSKRLRGWRFVLFNLALGLGHMIVLFNAGSYIALMPHVAGDLGGVAPSLGTWAQTDFMIGLALAFPIARWMSGRWGDYPVLATAFVAYAVASYLCAISETLWLFLPARIFLGFAGGITLPIGQALLLQEYPDRLKSVGLGVWGMFTLTPFTVGCLVGGWIADELGWRHLFGLNIVCALGIAGVTGSLLYGRGCRRRYTRFDFVGFMLLSLILGGVQTLLNQGNDFDWLDSLFLRGVFIAVIVALPCLVIWEQGERHPAFDVRLFAHRNFAIGTICLTVGFLGIQGLLSLFIVQLQLLLGYTSYLAGLLFLSMFLLAAPVIAVMHELIKGVDARLFACLNLLGFAFTFRWIGLFDAAESFDQIVWPMLLLGFFLGSFFTPLTALTLHGLSGTPVMRAAEAVALLRIAAGAFGITLQGVVLFRRSPFHQLDLADHFGGRRFASLDLLQQASARLENAGLDAGSATAKLGALIRQQAGILALNDAFLLASYLFLGLAALVWLAHATHRPLHPSMAEDLNEIRVEELMEEP